MRNTEEAHISLEDLHQDDKNPRVHSQRNMSMLARSVEDVGAARSGVIDENNTILAGNGTFEALRDAGITKVRVVPTDGNEWVVVQRTGLSRAQKDKLKLYDNRTAELASYDKTNLEALDLNLEEFFFKDELQTYTDSASTKDYEDKEINDDVEGFRYQIIVECVDEREQAALLAKFETEEIQCRALIV